MAARPEAVPVPPLFTQLPAIRDSLSTETSKVQDETVEHCLPFLRGTDATLRETLNAFGVSRLRKDQHIEYLYDSLEDYPSSFAGLDSSRPWMVYWALTGLALLGEDVTKYRERYDDPMGKLSCTIRQQRVLPDSKTADISIFKKI